MAKMAKMAKFSALFPVVGSGKGSSKAAKTAKQHRGGEGHFWAENAKVPIAPKKPMVLHAFPKVGRGLTRRRGEQDRVRMRGANGIAGAAFEAAGGEHGVPLPLWISIAGEAAAAMGHCGIDRK